jgi:putative flippase GtrA
VGQVNQKTKLQTTKRVGKFGAVGVINTALDFLIYNLLVFNAGFPLIAANIVSTSVAMSFSFVANKTFVFGERKGNLLRQISLFLLVTTFGLYVLQNLVIWLLAHQWPAPLGLAYDLVELVGLGGVFSKEFVVTNGAKVIATGFSLVWNYQLYRRVVYRQ